MSFRGWVDPDAAATAAAAAAAEAEDPGGGCKGAYGWEEVGLASETFF